MSDRALSGESLADRVEVVLLKHDRGPMHVTGLIRELGLESDPSAMLLAPQLQLVRALLEDERRRTARGNRPRFVVEDSESVRLRARANPAEQAVEEWNEKVKLDLLEQLRACEPYLFEQIVGELIRAMGYEDVRVTNRSKDGGIDILAIYSAGGVARVSTALQVKRWRKPVGRPEVQALRGSLGSTQQGVIVTTSQFSEPAVVDARRQDGNAVHLIDGGELVDLMVEHGLGVSTSRVVQFSLNEQFFTGSPDSAPATTAAQLASPVISQTGRRYFLAQLPSGRSADYLATVAAMAQLAEQQPSLDEYIVLFQRQFPSITRVDEARRRMRVLLSLGLVDIESDHVALTFLGRRFLDEREPHLLGEAFLARIAGASEIQAMVRGLTSEKMRKRAVEAAPPAGLSATQANLVLRWLTQLGLV
jgi:restriction endonuclease Mrr